MTSAFADLDIDVHRTEVDGVPVLWTPGPAPLAAALVFGCGARDESLPTIGVTHLDERLSPDLRFPAPDAPDASRAP